MRIIIELSNGSVHRIDPDGIVGQVEPVGAILSRKITDGEPLALRTGGLLYAAPLHVAAILVLP